MPDFAVSYLLKETYPDLHAQFKKVAMDYGFSDRILIPNLNNDWTFFVLPHTTLWGVFQNTDLAVYSFREIENAVKSGIIERFLITERNSFYVSSNRRFSGRFPANELSACIENQLAYP